MVLKKTLCSLIVILFAAFTLVGQNFLPPVYSFSKKKTAIFNMETGKTVKANIKSFDWKKGLIEEVKIVDMKGKKVKVDAEKIKSMYLPPSGWSKFASSWNFLSDPKAWGETSLDKDIISKGYSYMEKSEVRIKKKTRTLILQLLNPSYAEKLKVYNDPLAKETMSVGIGGMKLAGGLEKSYFVKKEGEKVSWKLEKKNYKEEFKALFGDNKAVMKKYGDAPKWSEFETHVWEYTRG